jgi:hypothetical protein
MLDEAPMPSSWKEGREIKARHTHRVEVLPRMISSSKGALEALTPEALERTVRAIVAEREPVARSAVPIGAIGRRLVADGVLDVDLADSRVAEKMARRIEQQVAFVEGMSFIENE